MYILIIIPTPDAIAVAIIPASNNLPSPDISSPEIKSLTALINGTPGSKGIIVPTISIFGVSKIPSSVKITPLNAIVIDVTSIPKRGILVILSII